MYGVIDIGSNTIRLVVFDYDGTSIRRVLNKKITAGLAGYINKDHEMRKRGVQVAVESLMELKTVTDQFSLDEIGVFARHHFGTSSTRKRFWSRLRRKPVSR